MRTLHRNQGFVLMARSAQSFQDWRVSYYTDPGLPRKVGQPWSALNNAFSVAGSFRSRGFRRTGFGSKNGPPTDGFELVVGRLCAVKQLRGEVRLVCIARVLVLLSQPVQLVRGDVSRERQGWVRGGGRGQLLPLLLPGRL